MADRPLPPSGGAGPLGAGSPEGLVTPEFLASLLADGDDDLAAWVMAQALAVRPRALVYDDIVRRAMSLVGERWERGEWPISTEHLASVALASALARVRPPLEPESRIGPVVVLAAPAEEQHVAGLACLAQVLADRGWQPENLGANVPEADLVKFLSDREVDLVALSIGTAGKLPALQRTIDAVGAAGGALARLPIMAGGHGVEGHESEVHGADLVTASLAEAERFVDSLPAARERSKAE
jgi:MerR family transcriptional regulator, light-induced transcriptional regulator